MSRRCARSRCREPRSTTCATLSPIAAAAIRRDEAVDDALSALMSNMERSAGGHRRRGQRCREDMDTSLQGNEPSSLATHCRAVQPSDCNRWRSTHFRHAVRLAAGMLGGYLLMLALHPTHAGYWILLTTLFVCQPSYGSDAPPPRASASVGTTAGLVAGWAMLRLLPGRRLAPAGPRRDRAPASSPSACAATPLATAVITLFVLLCFDPRRRAATTPLARACSIPCWAPSSLPWRSVSSCPTGAYAASTMSWPTPCWPTDATWSASPCSTRNGKSDDLPYRIARRDAHAAQAAVAGNVTELLARTRPPAERGERALRLLTTLQRGLCRRSVPTASARTAGPGAGDAAGRRRTGPAHRPRPRRPGRTPRAPAPRRSAAGHAGPARRDVPTCRWCL